MNTKRASSMTKEQIDKLLKYYDDYEMSLRCNIWDDPNRVTMELVKILELKSKLRAMMGEVIG